MKNYILVVLLVSLFNVFTSAEDKYTGYRMDFGEITLEIGAWYNKICDNKGYYAGKYKGYEYMRRGAFWTPLSNASSDLPPVRPLGHVVWGGDYQHPDTASILVRPSSTATNSPPLADPVDYNQVYNSGGYSYMDTLFSVWTPVPPAGYVALGLVVVTGLDKPATNIIYTVRKDLTVTGAISGLSWSTSGGYSSAPKAAFYNITAPGLSVASTATRAMIAPNSFMFQNNYDTPLSTPVVNVLWLEMPSKSNVTEKRSLVPTLTSFNKPADQSGPFADRALYIPMTALREAHRTAQQQAATSPFYQIRRTSVYNLQLFQNNQGYEILATTKTISYGVSNSRSHNFNAQAGVQLSFEAGVAIGPTFSASFSLQLGFSHTRTVVELKVQTLATTLRTPSQHASAIYTEMDTLTVLRLDDSQVVTLTYNPASAARVIVEYPRPAKARSVVALTEIEVEYDDDE